MLEGGLVGERYQYAMSHLDHCATCAKAVSKLASFERGDRKVGRYQLERVLGAGGMGVVYRAWDPQLRRTVAVKLLRPERSTDVARARMLREARALARVANPNVVAVYDVGEHEGEVFITTEFVDGETLESWITGKSQREIAMAWLQVARGLAAAHAEGVVHRDVKPANAFVGRDGRVRIGDFGLAMEGEREDQQLRIPIDSNHKLSVAGGVAGTPAYMSPEQWHGESDARSDQYGLCVSLVEALTGERPNEDTMPAVSPPALAEVLAKGLRGNPDERFGSMRELADALAASVSPPTKRWTIAVAGLSLAAIAVALSAIVAVKSRKQHACVPAELGQVMTAEQRAKLGPLAERLDKWSATWTAMAADVCVASDEPSIRAIRERCLDEGRTGIRQLVDRWEVARPSALRAYAEVEKVTRPALCTSVAAKLTPVMTLEQHAAITGARLSLAQAASMNDLRAVVELARQIEFAPFLVETLIVLAAQQPGAERVSTLRTALEVARDDRSFVVATLALIEALGPTEEKEALRLAEAARPKLVALGDTAYEALLDQALGSLAHAVNRVEDAIAAFERARRGWRFAYGEKSVQEAQAMVLLAGVYLRRSSQDPKGRELYAAAVEIMREAGIEVAKIGSLMEGFASKLEEATALLAMARESGNLKDEAAAEMIVATLHVLLDRNEEAIRHYQRIVEIDDKLKIVEIDLVVALSQMAALHGEAGRSEQGLPLIVRAIALAESLHTDPDLAAALSIQGELLINLRREVEAQGPLQRGLAMRIKLNAPGRQRGNTRFLLARALWKTDVKRARSLAGAAREDTQAALDEIDPEDKSSAYLRRDLAARLVKIDALLAAK